MWSNASLINETLTPCWKEQQLNSAKAAKQSEFYELTIPLSVSAALLVGALLVVVCVINRSKLPVPCNNHRADSSSIEPAISHDYTDPDSIYEEIQESRFDPVYHKESENERDCNLGRVLPEDNGYVINVQTTPEYIDLFPDVEYT